MNSPTQQKKKPSVSKREMIIWHGGVYWGLFVASCMFGIDLYRHTADYMPSRSPTSLVLFSWIWMLVVNPVIWFGAGCLFGFIMWRIREDKRSKSVNRNG
jgi:hypothetical protein